MNGASIRKGSPDAIISYVESKGNSVFREVHDAVDKIARSGGTPLMVAKDGKAVGVVHLKG